MNISPSIFNKLKDQLKLEEGFSSVLYEDTVGKRTIGYGRNLDDVGISEEEAEYLLQNDIFNAEKLVSKNIPFYTKLTDVRKCILVDMCFNMGIKNLLSFKNMLAYMNNEQYIFASDAMLSSKWAKQVGDRAVKLSRMMTSNMWID